MKQELEFTGFPQQALNFFKELAQNNNREWFQEHKEGYQELIQHPAQAFVLALGENLKLLSNSIEYDLRTSGVGSILRIYRDIRFSKDKTPYKTNLGIMFWDGPRKKMENPSFYFHMDATGAFFYAGFYEFTRDYLKTYRDAVEDQQLGPELVSILERIETLDEFEVGGECYKRVPSGFDKDHPRGDLLRRKGLWAKSPFIPSSVIYSSELVDVCFHYAVEMMSLHKWLVRIEKISI